MDERTWRTENLGFTGSALPPRLLFQNTAGMNAAADRKSVLKSAWPDNIHDPIARYSIRQQSISVPYAACGTSEADSSAPALLEDVRALLLLLIQFRGKWGKLKMRSLLLALAVALISCTSWAAAPTAKVEEGKLQGTIENGLTIYRGIPFAAPPLGDLRWRAPQPATKWQGVRSADKFAPQCVQSIAGKQPARTVSI